MGFLRLMTDKIADDAAKVLADLMCQHRTAKILSSDNDNSLNNGVIENLAKS